ncbi:hypothetical protein DFR58_1202 [Anaerobacterium chartisolvens]|uniref:Uncharacterized protein n=1 Tax=Anaerobacterium chartisolvens TaxID=1297424 RepID=A0A369AUI9_9FIRM|nr:hypothetical protein DFR58_1202 [Anaerobacterium chartisolvens]
MRWGEGTLLHKLHTAYNKANLLNSPAGKIHIL